MPRPRLSRRFQQSAQLILGLALPAFLVVAIVFLIQRRGSSQRRQEARDLYAAISNAVVVKVTPPENFRLLPFNQLQYEGRENEISYTGWYEVGPSAVRGWFRAVIDEGPPLSVSRLEVFDRDPRTSL